MSSDWAIQLPLMYQVRQKFETACLETPEVQVRTEVDRLLAGVDLPAGASIAVAVGSRGIAQLELMITGVVDELKSRGYHPFLIPAMGSHGGATPAGQEQVLQSLGLKAGALGVEVRSDLNTDLLGETTQGVPVYFSRTAREADAVILCNRVKPHTRFTGTVQSGLLKMLTIGLGKHLGAATYHQYSHHVAFAEMVADSVDLIAAKARILGGIAIVENARKQISHLEGVPFHELRVREPQLLQLAESLMPRLPVRSVDLLMINEIGKEISGTGMDTNVIGRKFNDHVSTPDDWCQTQWIYVRGVTAATAGNATGIGMAEFTIPEVVAAVDWQKTALNSITAAHPTAAMCPVVLANDREVLRAVWEMAGAELRLVQIQNTLQLEQIWISEPCLAELARSEQTQTNLQISTAFRCQFTDQGQLQWIPAGDVKY